MYILVSVLNDYTQIHITSERGKRKLYSHQIRILSKIYINCLGIVAVGKVGGVEKHQVELGGVLDGGRSTVNPKHRPLDALSNKEGLTMSSTLEHPVGLGIYHQQGIHAWRRYFRALNGRKQFISHAQDFVCGHILLPLSLSTQALSSRARLLFSYQLTLQLAASAYSLPLSLSTQAPSSRARFLARLASWAARRASTYPRYTVGACSECEVHREYN